MTQSEGLQATVRMLRYFDEKGIIAIDTLFLRRILDEASQSLHEMCSDCLPSSRNERGRHV